MIAARMAAAALALVNGCVVGLPPGFPAGETWTFPLVDARANGRP